MKVEATYRDYKNVIKLVDFINNNKVFRQYTGTDNIFDNIILTIAVAGSNIE
jgi:5-methylcytosine-specific restriction endonuclease McrBC regulatory subunit McrC